MDLPLETRAQLLMEAIKEDRVEIREARQRVYSVVAQVAIASFAITAFLIGKDGAELLKPGGGAPWWLPLVDVSFLMVMWAHVLRAQRDMIVGRLCVEAREALLRTLSPSGPFDPFPKVDMKAKPKMREGELYWLAVWTTVPLAAKLVAVCAVVR